jgi:STE24 endopeptidase
MEIGYVRKEMGEKPVILLPSNYIKAAKYKISSQRVDMLGSLVEYGAFIFWIGFGLKWLDSVITIEDVALKSVIYIYAFVAINYLITLPINLYESFVLDKEYGFSNITPKIFVTDLLKSALLFLVFGGAVVWLIAKIIINIDNWWVWGFLLIFTVVLVINMIYPTFIAPIFNKFEILKDESLKSSIEELLERVGLKSEGVYTIDASKRDNRLNAYFGGLGRSKRVVLFDTLIKKLSKDELLAVLGHELGHFKHKDILKNIALTGGLLLLMFAIFGNLPNSLFSEIGVAKTPYTVIALFLLLSSVVSFFYMPIFGYFSRNNEYRADEFGASMQSKEDLANALQKLANENRSFPKSHPLFIFFYHTHPPLLERLKHLGVKFD